jgi:DNA-binding response OmpR family regulator
MPPTKPLIFVLEDNKFMCDLICLHLTQAGYEARGYVDAVVGGRAMLAQRPDLLVLDIGMPYLDGLELLSAMRSDVNTADIPTIIVTARTDSKTEQTAHEAGAARFLTKPLQRQQLLDAVAEILGNRQDAEPAA